METNNILKAILLGVIEGITEFLPVSSTGHLIVFSFLIDFKESFSQAFEISVQAGAILAVFFMYSLEFKKIMFGENFKLLLNLFISFLPIAVIGLIFGEIIFSTLFFPTPVALAFIIGGILLIFIEKRYKAKQKKEIIDFSQISKLVAFRVGFFQALSLVPGFSRSGAAIIGAMYFGFSRSLATKFSFFLAVPVILAASVYSIFLQNSVISFDDIPVFVIGLISSFFSALLIIKWFIKYVSNKSLAIFGYYRIIVGLLILYIINF